VKSTSYAVNMAAEAEARRRGADDAVFVDAAGSCSKGRRRTSGGVEAHTLYTPSLELGILAGVTRASVIELARGSGYESSEGTTGSQSWPARTRPSPPRRSAR
jgi:branched-subunit amino acid aminotransferase/4-amino-4-deoxychorismate lyase